MHFLNLQNIIFIEGNKCWIAQFIVLHTKSLFFTSHFNSNHSFFQCTSFFIYFITYYYYRGKITRIEVDEISQLKNFFLRLLYHTVPLLWVDNKYGRWKNFLLLFSRYLPPVAMDFFKKLSHHVWQKRHNNYLLILWHSSYSCNSSRLSSMALVAFCNQSLQLLHWWENFFVSMSYQEVSEGECLEGSISVR